MAEPARNADWFGTRPGACSHVNIPSAQKAIEINSCLSQLSHPFTEGLKHAREAHGMCSPVTMMFKVYVKMTCSVLQKFLKQLNTLMDLVNIFRVTSDVFLRQKNVRERNRDFMNIKGASHSDERQRETVACSGVLATEIPVCNRVKHPPASASHLLLFPPNSSSGWENTSGAKATYFTLSWSQSICSKIQESRMTAESGGLQNFEISVTPSVFHEVVQ